MNKLIIITRWIFLIPLAILSGIAMLFPLHWILINTLSHFITPYPELPERILSPFVFSLTFVISGSKIAPNYKFYTSVFLFLIFMILTGVLIWFTSNNIMWFGKTLELNNGGVPFYLSIIGSFLGVYLASKDFNNVQPGYKSDEIFKELAPSIIFFLLFIFCIFNPSFRFFAFLLYFILIVSFLIFSIKNNLYTTFKLKFKLVYEVLFSIALLIGLINKDFGLIVSYVSLILITVGFVWSIIVNFKKENANNFR
jgi:hypothetical protein